MNFREIRWTGINDAEPKLWNKLAHQTSGVPPDLPHRNWSGWDWNQLTRAKQNVHLRRPKQMDCFTKYRITPGLSSGVSTSTFPSNLPAHLASTNEERFKRENLDPYLSPPHSTDAYLSYSRGIFWGDIVGRNNLYTSAIYWSSSSSKLSTTCGDPKE